MYHLLRYTGCTDQPNIIAVKPESQEGYFGDHPIRHEFSHVYALADKLDGMLDVFHAGSYLVMSKWVINLLRQVGEAHFAQFSITFETPRQARDTDHGIVHLFDSVTCLDQSASEFKRSEDGDITRIRRFVIDPERVPAGRQVFRMSECWGNILASDEFVRYCEARGIRGATFVRLDKINYWV